MTAPEGAWDPPCPVCGRPVADPGPGPARRAGCRPPVRPRVVVARIGATLTDLARDRDALLATLRAAAPGQRPRHRRRRAGPAIPERAGSRPGPPVGPPPPPPASPPLPPAPPRRRLSPQQVLLGLGALLVVAAAITFVAVAWTRFGLVFQAGVMLTVTTLLCGASAWTARRGCAPPRRHSPRRAPRSSRSTWAPPGRSACRTRGRLPAALVGDLVRRRRARRRRARPAHPQHDDLATRRPAGGPAAAVPAADRRTCSPARPGVAVGPGRWPLPTWWSRGRSAASSRRWRGSSPGVWTVAGVLGGLATAAGSDPATPGRRPASSWSPAPARSCSPAARPRRRPRFPELVPGVVGAVAGLALARLAAHHGRPRLLVASGLGLALLTAAVLLAGRTGPAAALVASGTALVGVHASLLADEGRFGELALVALAAVPPRRPPSGCRCCGGRRPAAAVPAP